MSPRVLQFRRWLPGYLVALALVGPPVFGAVIEGRVALPPTRHAPVANQRYEIVSRAGVLAPNPPLAVVYVEGSFPATVPAPVTRMAQKELAFVPTLLAIEVGTRVEFPNQDSTYHNIFSFSPAKRFDLGRYRSDEQPVPSVLFDQPGSQSSGAVLEVRFFPQGTFFVRLIPIPNFYEQALRMR